MIQIHPVTKIPLPADESADSMLTSRAEPSFILQAELCPLPPAGELFVCPGADGSRSPSSELKCKFQPFPSERAGEQPLPAEGGLDSAPAHPRRRQRKGKVEGWRCIHPVGNGGKLGVGCEQIGLSRDNGFCNHQLNEGLGVL